MRSNKQSVKDWQYLLFKQLINSPEKPSQSGLFFVGKIYSIIQFLCCPTQLNYCHRAGGGERNGIDQRCSYLNSSLSCIKASRFVACLWSVSRVLKQLALTILSGLTVALGDRGSVCLFPHAILPEVSCFLGSPPCITRQQTNMALTASPNILNSISSCYSIYLLLGGKISSKY